MTRPKAGTKEGDKATAKWRQTMLKKYGGKKGLSEHLKTMGAKGGRASANGGFASDKVGSDGLTGIQRARLAGAKGGRISRRGKGKTTTKPKEEKVAPKKRSIFPWRNK